MKRKDKAYDWWKSKPSSVRKPLVLTLGMLLVIVSPFTGLLPGPGGIPIFLLGIAILASEYDWANRIKAFFLSVIPDWVQKYWRITPKWLHFFDFIGLSIIAIGLLLIKWPVYLPIVNMKASLPFFYIVPGVEQQWWIPPAICIIAGASIFIFNRNRLNYIKKLFLRVRKSQNIK